MGGGRISEKGGVSWVFPQGTGEATVQQDVCASSMAVVLWGWQRGHMRSGWGTWVKRPFSLPDVEVRFPLAKLFGGEGAAEDVPSVLLVSGGARPGRLGLELLELALLAGGGEGLKVDGRGVGQVEGLADRCHGGGQLARPGCQAAASCCPGHQLHPPHLCAVGEHRVHHHAEQPQVHCL